jgi:putative tryptophan/tyrosine transport system substrate-binding protein
MRRRDFIAGLGGAAIWPLAARAQQGERVRRVGFLTYGAANDGWDGFRDELEKLGWVEGRNLLLDVRFADGDIDRAGTLAAQLTKLAPDVIVTVYGVAFRAVQQQTKLIPIVFIGNGDPVENGSVKNSAHPEGNTTGFANAYGSLGSKWMELLKEIAPKIRRVAFIDPPEGGKAYVPWVEAAARSLGVELVIISVRDADAFREAVTQFAVEQDSALLPGPGILAVAPFELIRLAEQYRLPAIYGLTPLVANGGLLGYSSDLVELQRGVAGYVNRLLRGAKVSDLPVQYPTKFHLAINLKTAKALGLTVPPSILLRADEVIE